MTRTKLGILAVAVLLVLAGGLILGAAPGGLAQDGTPRARDRQARATREPGATRERERGHPAEIRAGGCAEGEEGETVASLTALTAPRGEAVGQEGAAAVESSFTSVPLALETILAANHAIVVRESAQDDAEAIACGEIGGVLGENGDLVIGLRQQNRSGFTGVAYLSPGAGGASTDISVFLGENLDRAPRDDRTRGGTPAAGTPVGGIVDEAAVEEPAAEEPATDEDTTPVDVRIATPASGVEDE